MKMRSPMWLSSYFWWKNRRRVEEDLLSSLFLYEFDGIHTKFGDENWNILANLTFKLRVLVSKDQISKCNWVGCQILHYTYS